MRTTKGKLVPGLLVASMLCFLAMEFADARGRGGGGRSMSRGGPAASGSFQRSRARPQSNVSRTTMNRGNNMQGQRADRNSQQQDNRQDRFDQRQDNVDRKQDNRNERYDDRKEYRHDRNEWYEDRWRRGAYLSIASWNSRGCRNSTVVIVNGMTYYDCNNVRYERVYRGTEITYIIVN